ncbi:MAG: hypothetical protein KAR42_14140 [candidate division Zixibacteria bacterium]|nr:hypothetical protein [candidate division Zixibacteria bacterium]
MKIKSIKPYEECIGDEFMKLVEFDSEITKSFIHFLSEFGEMEYFSSFTRPLFTLTSDTCFTLKGVQGLTNARLILNPDLIEESLNKFTGIIDQFQPGIEYQLCTQIIISDNTV